VGRPLCGLLALAATGAIAQGMTGGMGSGLGVGNGGVVEAGFGSGGTGATGGSGGTGGRGFFVTPTLAANATLTDNVNLSATNKQSDLLLQLSPGIQIGGQSGRVKGFLNYALTASYSVNDSASSSFYNTLSAQLNAEVVPSRVFVDASASISQQYISPFGTQSPDPSLNNSNRTEVTTVAVAPRIEGQLGGQVDYAGRAFYTYTSSGTSQAPDSSAFGALLGFRANTRWSKLSWALDLSYRQVSFSDSRSEFDQLNVLSLIYAVTPELKVSLRGNTETSNVTSLQDETNSGWGAGLRWNPSPRTNLLLEYDQRIFGSSHVYSFDYRTPRTVWAISSRQGLSTGQVSGGQFTAGQGGRGSAFDLLFAQFASVQPDPVLRTQLVNDFLRANGIDPNSSLNTGYLPSQVTEELRNDASVAWLGMRSTVIFNVYQTQARNLGPLSNPGNNFANANQLDWLGFGLNLSHRLTPRDALTASLAQQRTSEADGTQETLLRTGSLMWTSQVGQRTTASLSARRTVFDSSTSPYNETAFLATVSMQF
jgi:uncharacterized protein (PEP-CTERM system associated)